MFSHNHVTPMAVFARLTPVFRMDRFLFSLKLSISFFYYFAFVFHCFSLLLPRNLLSNYYVLFCFESFVCLNKHMSCCVTRDILTILKTVFSLFKTAQTSCEATSESSFIQNKRI